MLISYLVLTLLKFQSGNPVWSLASHFFNAGGSAAKFLCNGLPSAVTEWDKWRVFFCDERYVPFDDPECTYTVYKNGLLSKVPALADYVYPINPAIPCECTVLRNHPCLISHLLFNTFFAWIFHAFYLAVCSLPENSSLEHILK